MTAKEFALARQDLAALQVSLQCTNTRDLPVSRLCLQSSASLLRSG